MTKIKLQPGPYARLLFLSPTQREILASILCLPPLIYYVVNNELSIFCFLPLVSIIVIFLFAKKTFQDINFLSSLTLTLSALVLFPLFSSPFSFPFSSLGPEPSYCSFPLIRDLCIGLCAILGGLLCCFFPLIFRANPFVGLLAAVLISNIFAASGITNSSAVAASSTIAASSGKIWLSLSLYPILLTIPLILLRLATREPRLLPAIIMFTLFRLSTLFWGPTNSYLTMFWIFLILFLLPDYLRAAKYFYLLPILFFIGILELLYPYTLYGSKIRIINLALTLAPAPLISLMYLFGQKSSKKTPSRPNPTKVALILCRRGEGELELLGDFPEGLSCSMMEASFPKGPYACPYACLGALDCVSSCQNSAIILSNNMPEVSPERCIGCGECISHCPRGLIRLIPKDAYVAIRCSGVHKMKLMDKLCLKGCLGCGLCRKACPLNAVEKPSAKAPPIINYHLCQGVPNCNMECKESCPRKLPDSVFPL